MAKSGCSNCILFILNVIALIISVPLMYIGNSLRNHPGYLSCNSYQSHDYMTIGVFLLCLSLMWFIGTWCRMRFLTWLHLFVMFLTILVILIVSLSSLVAIQKGEGQVVPQKGRDQYRIEDFSAWMQQNVRGKDAWATHRNCLVQYDYCKDLDKLISKLSAENYIKQFPTQWGCCKPPRQCGYEEKNATFWTIPKSGLAGSKDHDCLTYSNHQDTLCYDCETCKAGFLAGLRGSFKRMLIINTCIAIFLMIVSCMACSNLKSQRNSEHYGGYRNGMA